ncbi:hypothetical protein DA718_28695 [Klebsiella huaxiensis]|nr:hypothetical protein DA718_28695 [Klebsiella huaxiensis]
MIRCLSKTPAPKCHNMLPLFVSSAGLTGLQSCRPGKQNAARHKILSQNACTDRCSVKQRWQLFSMTPGGDIHRAT